MSTLANAQVSKECCLRLERLTPDARRRWGRMTAHEMVCHLSDSFRAAMREKPVSMMPGPIPRRLIKWIALHTSLPWAKNLQTRPEVEQGRGGTPPKDWPLDVDTLRRLLVAFPLQKEFARHPIFGAMDWSDWQIWGFRHVDHHFRQFGV
jgi:hypothetical protein